MRGNWQLEGITNNQRELGGISRLVLASHDDHLLPLLKNAMTSLGIEVLSLADFYLPEPPVSDSNLYIALRAKAAVISAATELPAISHARSFLIDPLLEGKGPQWRWPVPWPGTCKDLSTELLQADNALNRGGYCGPDDRGALFQTVLCLVLPDASCQLFEGRMQGQFAQLYHDQTRQDEIVLGFADCFVPDGESATIANLGGDLRQWGRDQTPAIDALRHSLKIGLRGCR